MPVLYTINNHCQLSSGAQGSRHLSSEGIFNHTASFVSLCVISWHGHQRSYQLENLAPGCQCLCHLPSSPAQGNASMSTWHRVVGASAGYINKYKRSTIGRSRNQNIIIGHQRSFQLGHLAPGCQDFYQPPSSIQGYTSMSTWHRVVSASAGYINKY